MKFVKIVLMFCLVFPLGMRAQHIMLASYENLPYSGYSDYHVFDIVLMYLEEGKQAPFLNWKVGYEIPRDYIDSWACHVRPFFEAKNPTSARRYSNFKVFPSMEYAEIQNLAHDSIFIDRVYLEIIDDTAIKVNFSMRLVEHEGKKVRFDLKIGGHFGDIDFDEVLRRYKNELKERVIAQSSAASFKIESLGIPPPPAIKIDSIEYKRHERAIATFNCQNPIYKESVLIPGTRLSIIPPEGFEIASDFTGMKKGGDSKIDVHVVELANFYTKGDLLWQHRYQGREKEKVVEIKRRSVQFLGYEAKFVDYEVGLKEWGNSILFGDSSFSVIIVSKCPIDDEETAIAIKESLLSIKYQKEEEIATSSENKGPFSLDLSDSRFKLSERGPSHTVFTEGGLDIKENPNSPALVIVAAPIEIRIPPKSATDFAISNLEGKDFKVKKIKSTSSEKVNQYDSYFQVVEFLIDGHKRVILVQAIANDKKTIMIQGYCSKKPSRDLEKFRKILATLIIH